MVPLSSLYYSNGQILHLNFEEKTRKNRDRIKYRFRVVVKFAYLNNIITYRGVFNKNPFGNVFQKKQRHPDK